MSFETYENLPTKSEKTKFINDLFNYFTDNGFKFIFTSKKDGEREMEPLNNKHDLDRILKKFHKLSVIYVLQSEGRQLPQKEIQAFLRKQFI